MTLTAYEQWVANSVGALVNAADPMEMMRAVKNAPAETRYMTLLSFARVARPRRLRARTWVGCW